MKLQAGQEYGRYTIVADELAEGLCGPVYHAVIEHNDKRREEVALKFLTNKNPQVAQYFLNEERLLKKASHPAIVRYVHSNVRDEPFALATAFTYAHDHREVAKKKSSALALQIAEEIGAALDYLHRSHPNHPVVHRDVKPDNILIDSVSGKATLIDLSVASHPQFALVDDRGFGTPPYMAPEQYIGHEVPATDQFALALVVYYFLHGTAMFSIKPPKMKDTDSHDAAVYAAGLAVWQDQVRPLLAQQQSKLRQTLHKYPRTAAVLERAIAFEPQDRYPSCAAFASELKQALGADGASLEQADLSGADSRRSTWLSAIVVGLLMAVAAALLFFTSGVAGAPPASPQARVRGELPATSTLPDAEAAVFATVTLVPEPTITLGPLADGLQPTSTLAPFVTATGATASGREIRLKSSEILRAAPGDGSLNVLRTRKLPAGERLTVINPIPVKVKGDRRPWYQVQRSGDGVRGWIPEGSFE